MRYCKTRFFDLFVFKFRLLRTKMQLSEIKTLYNQALGVSPIKLCFQCFGSIQISNPQSCTIVYLEYHSFCGCLETVVLSCSETFPLYSVINIIHIIAQSNTHFIK
jgi:hypothetical protein